VGEVSILSRALPITVRGLSCFDKHPSDLQGLWLTQGFGLVTFLLEGQSRPNGPFLEVVYKSKLITAKQKQIRPPGPIPTRPLEIELLVDSCQMDHHTP
jgi:hypothetical protein